MSAAAPAVHRSALPASTAFLSVAELGAKLRRRETTAEALAEFYLDRLHRIGPKLNLVVTVTDQLALEQARAADADFRRGHVRGPLQGIPWGAKDLLDTAGIRTTWGCPAYADRVPKDNATVVDRLHAAGAVLVAKLAMIELAGAGNYQSASAAITGPARNPWNPKRWTGGSSSGPGGAVAAGLVGFAIGSETWGSIINPTTYCGISGLRPTYGRVSRAGAMALSWTMDKLGPMARRMDDLPLILSAIAGADPRDPTCLHAPFAYPGRPANLRGFRLGYFPADRLPSYSPVKEPYSRALAVFHSLGAEMIPTHLPQFPYGLAAETVLDVEGAAAFENLMAGPDFQKVPDAGQKIGLYAGAQVKGVDYLRAFRIRGQAQAGMLAYLHGFDAIINTGAGDIAPLADVSFAAQEKEYEAKHPHRPSAAPHGAEKNYELSGAGNLLGLPAAGVSVGFSAQHHMPVGLEIMGAPLAEARVLQVAAAYQAATPWHRQHPSLADL
jgi:aspartyl-tRNA(Asn)/glutamyl-tRNA(Gln) amidotransferase subunit A